MIFHEFQFNMGLKSWSVFRFIITLCTNYRTRACKGNWNVDYTPSLLGNCLNTRRKKLCAELGFLKAAHSPLTPLFSNACSVISAESASSGYSVSRFRSAGNNTFSKRAAGVDSRLYLISKRSRFCRLYEGACLKCRQKWQLFYSCGSQCPSLYLKYCQLPDPRLS